MKNMTFNVAMESLSFSHMHACNSIFSFEDPGPHGGGRYSMHMLPEVEKKYFRKGSQVPFEHICS